MIKKLIFIVVVCLCFTVEAQVPISEISVDTQVFPKEKVALAINSNLLLAGELLEYKAFSQNASNKESILSKVLYVSMRNEADSVVFSHKLKIKNGMAHGDFFIPATLKTGIYNLIGYTNFSRNNSQNAFAQKTIYVLNTFQKPVVANKSRDTVQIKAIPKNELKFPGNDINAPTVNITPNKSSYGTREKVVLKLEQSVGSKGGNYALSVRKVAPISFPINPLKAKAPANGQVFYIPEVRGELISGTLLSKNDSQPMANKDVTLTIPGKGFVFKLAKTNKKGRFFFSISEVYKAENYILQVYDANRENYKLLLDDKGLKIEEETTLALKLDPNLKDWLQERSVQLQVENAYFNIKKDSILERTPNAHFFDNLGKNYVLDDYTRFPSVRETFVEVITTAAVRNEGNGHRLVVFNEYNPDGSAKFNSIDPLVIVDGMLIQENEELLRYSANDIWSIRVIAKPYRYGPKIYSGIIAVTTKKSDFAPTLQDDYIQEIKIAPAVADKKYYRPDYSNKQNLARIPDYRVQLLWQPNLSLDKDSYTTSFYTSDVSGLYEVSIEGYTVEGDYVSAKTYINITEEG